MYSGGKPVLTEHQSLANYVTLNTAQTITGAKTFTVNVTAAGYKKNNSSDSYVLLGGGGHKAVSDFMLKTEELKLVSEWDKTFPQSEKVDHTKVTFVNRYGITLAADLYKPKNVSGQCPAIAVSGSFGAVKEHCSGLYAQTMAEIGY